MNELNPIRIWGNWKEGYALDWHTLKSIYLGVDEWGHNQYETTRSKLGEMVYQLKYNQNISVLDEMIHLIAPFLDWWNISSKVSAIIPVPPSNINRIFQPVFEICNKLSEYLAIPLYTEFLIKNNHIQSKNLDRINKIEISGSIKRRLRFQTEVNVLLIDDLFQTGSTLTECVKILKTDSHIRDIFVLTMTKTRRVNK
ncbi:ComF family protein [Caldifermentibacillus hisashii]|uniref:ComF family protein n=1 Tax=Caldifermentibacillus hisashii TaxID=996558 RepID=UPI001838E8F8|nr:ComF family protein [Bacillus sp. (in: firmicutes)]